MAYIKGIYVQDIFSNTSNGYLVGLFRVKDSDQTEYINKVITFTGIFDELKYKMTYLMQGEFVSHNKYGNQFQVSSYELVMPSKEEEIVDFLSSDLFPIGEKTAEKIVNKLGTDTINIIINDPDRLLEIPRLSKEKIDKIVEVLNEYQMTSHIVLELSKLGFSTKNAITIMKKHNNKTLDIINNNIYDIMDDIDISFNEIDKIARNNGYELNDERRLMALTIDMMNTITFNQGDTYLYFDEMYNYMLKNTDNISHELFNYILLKLSKLNQIVIVQDKYYLWELYEDENYIARRIYQLNNI